MTSRTVSAQLIGPGTDGLYKYMGATIELSGAGRHWFATVRFRNHEKDFDGRSSDEALEKAKEWIEAAPEHRRDFYGKPIVEAGGRRVADFNTLDDLIAHARDELGATHVEPEHDTYSTRLFFPRKDGQYEVANTWQKAGYWHATGPGSREIIRHLPRGAQPIEGSLTSKTKSLWKRAVGAPRGRVEDYEAIDRRDRVIAGPFKSYGDAKDAAGPAGAVRFVPSRGKPSKTTEAHATDKTQAAFRRLDHFFGSPSAQKKRFKSEDEAAASAATLLASQMRMSYGTALKIVREWYRQGGVTEARRSPARAAGGVEEAGEQYAYDQVQSDHFMDWVRDQMLEARKSPSEDVLPLETKTDAMKIARNMLQQLEWDTRRELRKDEITDLIGEDGDVAEFWEGFREASVASRDWLADELLTIKGEMNDPGEGWSYDDDSDESKRRRGVVAAPRFRKPTQPKYKPGKIYKHLKVTRVVPSNGAYSVEFNDGFSVQVHGGSGRDDLLYAMHPYDTRLEQRAPGPESRRDYQYAALKAVLGDKPADFIVDHDGDVRAVLTGIAREMSGGGIGEKKRVKRSVRRRR